MRKRGVHAEEQRLEAGRRAHGEHAIHVRDAGGVEAQRLVERRRALPSRKEGMRSGVRCGLGGRVEVAGRRVGRGGGANGMYKMSPAQG